MNNEDKKFEEELNQDLDTNEDLSLDSEELQDEEMTDSEVQDEIEEDEEDKIQDDIEQPFYATNKGLDELRDVLVELDYRLFLINDNIVVIGRLNGTDIEILVKYGTEEDSEYKFVKAPNTLDKFLAEANVLYLSPDMTKEELESFEGKEANQESVMEFLMNKLPETAKEEIEETEEDFEDMPEENGDIDEESFEEENDDEGDEE